MGRGCMKLWAREDGTLWVWDPASGVPPRCQARIEVEFAEVESAEVDRLAAAMNQSSETVRRRLATGRRCFVLKVADDIAAYGWVTHGVEQVGELERQFNLHPDEAYLWDFATRPSWRGQGLYSALLSHIIYRLHDEGAALVWIGASRQNAPSVKGFENAGFQWVVDVIYRRFWRLTLFTVQPNPSAPAWLVTAADRIMINRRERRFGRFALGYKQK
jgi:GNAT superfamily N-acetyltransferase